MRSGISRAYYGVFCIARDKKELKNYRGPNTHWHVINQYQNSNNPKEKRIGKNLDNLRKRRNDADYDEDIAIDSQSAQRVLLKANNILKALSP